MLYLISFWTTYFVVGKQIDHQNTKFLPNHYISPRTEKVILIINLLLSFLLLPLFNFMPIIVYLDSLPIYLIYPVRWLLATILSDIWLYYCHTLLHRPEFYSYHKLHHNYVVPHPIAGLVVHPIEFIFSNYMAMMIPLLIISHQELMPLETAFVAFDILMSHIGYSEYPSSKYHLRHHLKNNCNYGFMYIMDIFYNTYSN